MPPEEVSRRLDMFLGMADLGDAFDPKSYPGLFTDLLPADREAAAAQHVLDIVLVRRQTRLAFGLGGFIQRVEVGLGESGGRNGEYGEHRDG